MTIADLAARLWRIFEHPHRFYFTRQKISMPGARILDVGCGNHSPSITRAYFPQATYHAVDRSTEWNLDDRDVRAMDRFFEGDLNDPRTLDRVPDGWYDVVLCSHVLEHLQDPNATAVALARKVTTGGVLYIEVPGRRSATLPRAAEGFFGIRGCLNFWDDPTHVQLVDLGGVSQAVEAEGFTVSPVRRRRMARRIILLPLYAGAGLVLRRYVPASVVWDVVGFADFIVATREH